MTWLELIAWLLIGGAIWTLGGLWLAWSEAPASGERGAAHPRVAPTGIGPVQDYATVAQDYHEHGDEDPPLYGAPHAAAIMNQMAADDAKHRAVLKRRLARPRLIKRRRDGLKLSDEATADVLRTIFGDDPPPR